MSEENVELVRSMYEAFNRRDWESAFGLAAPDFEFTLQVGPNAGPLRPPIPRQPRRGPGQDGRLPRGRAVPRDNGGTMTRPLSGTRRDEAETTPLQSGTISL